MSYNWTKKRDWWYVDDTKGHIVGSIATYSFPISCFIMGGAAGDYTDIETAKRELIEKLTQKKLI